MSTRLSRDESRGVTIEKLKAAALGEFAGVGFAGASVDRICEAAGYSRGAFYANYKTKQDLLLDLLDQYNAAEIADWRTVIDSAQDMESIYVDMAARFERYVAKADWGILAVEVMLHARRNEVFAKSYRTYQEAMMANVTQALALMFEKAGRRPPAPLADLALAMRSYTTGLSLDYGLHSAHSDPHTASTLLVIFLRGLLAQGRSIEIAG
ncbi:MAG TPA: TetR/AcrR family transcriptional regulator [Pseudoduganella sp.]